MPHKLPLVSIIVLNWNGKKVIRQSLNSIRKLKYPNIEVIVVDNNSTDGSTKVIRKEFSEFLLVRNRKNLGFAAGMNVGIRKAKGEMILLYNNDAIIHPRSLSILVNRALSNDTIGMVSGLVLYYEPRDMIWSLGGMFDIVSGTIWSEGLGKRLTEIAIDYKPITDVGYLSGCVLLVKKEVINKIGLLDEELFLGGDDIDWCLKANRAGYRCILDPSAVVWHIGSYSLRQLPLKSYHERQKSDFRIILSHFPFPFLISALFFQLFAMPLIELLVFRKSDVRLSQRFRARVQAFSENLRTLRKLLHKRKQLHKLGTFKPKIRTLNLLKFAPTRIRATELYMGKLFQKERL
ncbi:MAG: glycosyltransferase family 2 protein [Candidatus Hodarchaeota archaeon]